MVEVDFDTVLIYGFALFFIFAALVIMIVRYSNKQLLKKIGDLKVNMAEEMAKIDKEMRRLVIISARERTELLSEVAKVKGTAVAPEAKVESPVKMEEKKETEKPVEKKENKVKVVVK